MRQNRERIETDETVLEAKEHIPMYSYVQFVHILYMKRIVFIGIMQKELEHAAKGTILKQVYALLSMTCACFSFFKDDFHQIWLRIAPTMMPSLPNINLICKT